MFCGSLHYRGTLNKEAGFASCSSKTATGPEKAGAGDEAQTRDVLLGKEVLYH